MEELTNIRNVLTLLVTIAGSSATLYQYFDKEEIVQVKQHEAGESQRVMIEMVEYYKEKCK